jgi:hypothetical protein
MDKDQNINKDQIIECVSFGLILFKYDNNCNMLKFLMVKKRLSYEFCDFVKGYINCSDIEFVKSNLEKMTTEELKTIETMDFDIMWDKFILYMDDDKKESYKKYKTKFKTNVLPHAKPILDLFKNLKYNNVPIWEFPKGKKIKKSSGNEEALVCAKRELHEETNIPDIDYIMINTYRVKRIKYLPQYNIKYINLLYMAEYLKNMDEVPYFNYQNKNQIAEIDCIEWMSIYDIIKYDGTFKKSLEYDILPKINDYMITKYSITVLKKFKKNNVDGDNGYTKSNVRET